MPVSTELLGYLALATGFFAITRREMGGFRLWHLISNFLYIFYGWVLGSGPLLISGVAFCLIHAYHLGKLRYPDGLKRFRRPRGA